MPDSSIQIEINYPPNFKSRYGYGGLPLAKNIQSILKNKEKEQLKFLSKILLFKDNFSSISINAKENNSIPRWNQNWFPPLDGMSMYTMIASNKPNKYIEIGSGNSTKFAVQAIKDYSLDTEVISIDPQPREEIDNICDKIIRSPLENTPELVNILADLKLGDVVFFDGSHRCFQNSDVTAFFIDYLPIIPAGVFIGIHDIFWPFDYPDHWVTRYYNEQYMLGAYMLGMGENFQLVFSCKYMQLFFAEDVNNCLDSELLSQLKNLGLGAGGGALWFLK